MKKKIAIVRGGNSKEIYISLKTADVVFKFIDRQRYIPYLIHIEKQDWYLLHKKNKYRINKADFSCRLNKEKIQFDGVFIAIHGTPGEDGILQAYFDLINIPYQCSGTFESSITFNKSMCNSLLKQFNIKSANAILLKENDQISLKEIEKNIGFPCFVKPNRSGSSYGISKVTEPSKYRQAIKHALKYDQEIIVESFIDGIEVSCGIIQKGKKTIALPVTEISSENDFFDYEAKYNGKSVEITPAKIEKVISNNIQVISKKIYKILSLKGIIRIDYIIQNNIPFLIEINTIPGLSEESIIPQQAKCYGLGLKELFNLSIDNIFFND